MYEHLIIGDGGVVFPAYTSKEARQVLRDRLARGNVELYCSCSRDDKLFYKISADLRFVPCHQNYIHQDSCVRAVGKRKSAFVHDDEAGVSVAYLRFNPANFSVPVIKKGDSDEMVPSEVSVEEVVSETSKEEKKKEKKDKEDKEPFSPLAEFIRSINFDSYMSRLISTGKVYSYEYFLSSLYSRLQYIRISPMKKSIKELDYKVDGFKFFYAELDGYTADEYSKLRLKYFGKTSGYFVFPTVLEKALNSFVKQYGVEPDFKSDKLMAAGFMYEKVSKKGNLYLTPGRLHIFKVNDLGVYCDNQTSLLVTNILYGYIQTHKLYNKCRLYFDFDDYDKICDLRMVGRSDYLSFTYIKRDAVCSDEKNIPCYAVEETCITDIVTEWFDGRY